MLDTKTVEVKNAVVFPLGTFLLTRTLNAMTNLHAYANTEKKPGERRENCDVVHGDSRCEERVPNDQLMEKLFTTLCSGGANGGIFAPRNLPATHPPVGVPEKGPSMISTAFADPVEGSNVIFARPAPGSPRLHD